MALAVGVASVLRVVLLWDDPWAPGYDGGYYALQVGSWIEGAPIFADRSLVYPLLAGLGRLTGDVVLGNKLAALAFGAITAAAGVQAGWRWTGSRAAALTMGLWWAASPLHLGVSAEYLKNACGVMVLALLIAALARRGGLRQLVVVLALAALGPFVHKLTGLLGLGLVAASIVLGVRRLDGRVVAGLALTGVLGAIALSAGVLRAVDLGRFAEAADGIGRAAVFGTDLGRAEQIEVALLHLSPLALLALLWGRRALWPLGGGLLLLSLVALAPGLPFGWELTSWRLMLMGFIPLGAAVGLLAARAPALGLGMAALVVLGGPGAARSQAEREPDYVAWATQLEAVKAVVPAGDRVVAHRGVCGFIWSEGDRVCENFQPAGPPEGWWRVVYGMGASRLSEDCSTVVELIPAYTLVPESCWRVFRERNRGRFSLVMDPRNPYEPRPAFVYGPGGDTPAP